MLTQAPRTSEQGLFAESTEDKNSLRARINRMIESIKRTGQFDVGANELATLGYCQDFVYDIWCNNASKLIVGRTPRGSIEGIINCFALGLMFSTPFYEYLFGLFHFAKAMRTINQESPFLPPELSNDENTLTRKAILNLLDLFQVEKDSKNQMPCVYDVKQALKSLVGFRTPPLIDAVQQKLIINKYIQNPDLTDIVLSYAFPDAPRWTRNRAC